VLLGIPAYARHVRDPLQVKTFAEMLTDALQDGSVTAATVIDVDNVGSDHKGYRGESPRRVRRKVELARSLKLGGVFFWELGQDLHVDRDGADGDEYNQGFGAPGGVLLEAAAEGKVYGPYQPDRKGVGGRHNEL
jgi:hypothetical protein